MQRRSLLIGIVMTASCGRIGFDPTDCPAGYTPGVDSCYRFVPESQTWQQARDHCTVLDGHLVVIDDATENATVSALSSTHKWIGLEDIAVEGMFRWVTDAPFEYEHWGQGDPEPGAFDCVHMTPSSFWDDDPCTNEFPSVCEMAQSGL